MVAELTGIPVSASVSNGSYRTKSLASKIIGNVIGSGAGCYYAASSSTSSSGVSVKGGADCRSDRENSGRPRWIRNATREPIYSVLDVRETRARGKNREESRARTRVKEYEISAVRKRESSRDTDRSTIRRDNRGVASSLAKNRQEIGKYFRTIEEESSRGDDPLPIYRVKPVLRTQIIEDRQEIGKFFRTIEEESSRGNDPLPIYRVEPVIGKRAVEDRQEIGTAELADREETECEEYALYSVVRKPPKLVFPIPVAVKLPILPEEEERKQQHEDESTREEIRDEATKKHLELRKWLESASNPRDSATIGSAERSPSSEMLAEDSPIEWIDGGPRVIGASVVKTGADRSTIGGVVSTTGCAIGTVGPFCRVYRDPNEQREYMLREEFQERAIDVGDVDATSGSETKPDYDVIGKPMIDEDEADSVTLVDSASDAGTFVERREDRRILEALEKSVNTIVDESLLVVEEQRYRPRAKWRFNDEDDASAAKKIDSPIDKGKIERLWSNEQVNRPNPSSKDNYDHEVPPKYTSTKSEASNEPHDKDSLNETGSTTGGTVEGNQSGNPARGERSGAPSERPASNEGGPSSNAGPPPRSLVSRILARARSSDDLLDHSEPYSQLWIVLSNVYGELVIVLMMALCLAEVMDTPVPLLSLQSVFLMYLYVGSIAVIISIYFWVLVDSCGSLTGGRTEDAELGGASLTRFGSLKRAHISRARTAPTSFYIRVGALLFGLATLVFNGLEMAMHTMMQGAECLSDIIFVHPVLHGLFTFLQMHFLFVNSQVLVERFGLAARFGFIHLAATNIAVWARLVIWDSAQEWTYFVHLAQRGPETSASPLNLRGFPGSLTRRARDLMGKTTPDGIALNGYQPISPEQISQVVTLQECLNTNTLGQLWTSSMPFLYPFIVQFSLIAAAVTFVMGQNVGKNRYCHKQKYHTSKDLALHSRVGCDGSSKGLFLGILCMTAGIVVILIFLVVREDDKFSPASLSWLTCGTLIGILALSGAMTASGLVQVRQMSIVSRAPATLDTILANVALFGVQLYAIFTSVVCACSLATHDDEDSETRGRHSMLLAASILQLVQCYAQSTLIAETSKRSCITRGQMMAKPARQVVTFLLFSNAVLWAFDTVVTQNWVSQELQLRFFGVLAWGIVSRICLPLVVFYRFHSCVLLLEAWNKCYRIPRIEHPLN